VADRQLSERMSRMEERLNNHLEASMLQEQRWLEMYKTHNKLLVDLNTKMDSVLIARAEERGALKALLWAGGALLTLAGGIIYKLFGIKMGVN
jgi:hypothetical protein